MALGVGRAVKIEEVENQQDGDSSSGLSPVFL